MDNFYDLIEEITILISDKLDKRPEGREMLLLECDIEDAIREVLDTWKKKTDT